jgi:hypothetical protein
VGERIPRARAALGRRVPGVELEESAHVGIVAEYGRRMDGVTGELRVRGHNRLCALECSCRMSTIEWNTRGLDEGRQDIVRSAHLIHMFCNESIAGG